MLQQDRERLERLARWSGEHGVISIYLEIDPADRSEGWRVELRDRLNGLVEQAGERDSDSRVPLEATAARILERFPENASHPSGRTQIGFVEVAEKPAAEDWQGVQLPGPGTVVVHRPRPLLGPLVELLERGARRAIVAVSAERVRAWRWEMGRIEPQDAWEVVLTTPQWHERKAPAMRDPARGQGVSSSGHDQFDQRLEANRERFLHEAGRRISAQLNRDRWHEVVVFGDPPYLEELLAGLGKSLPVHTAPGDLIDQPEEQVASRVNELLERLRSEAAAELVEKVKGAALSHDGRGSLGFRGTAEALAEGRVDRLLFVPDADYPQDLIDDSLRAATNGAPDEGDPLELIIALAVRTSADLIPLVGEAADELRDEHGGVAAILRY
jgi:hypothetical protein